MNNKKSTLTEKETEKLIAQNQEELKEALKVKLIEYMEKVLTVRNAIEIDDVELISTKLAKKYNVDEMIKEKAISLKDGIRKAIEEGAKTVERLINKPFDDSIKIEVDNSMLGLKKIKKLQAIADGIVKVNISLRTANIVFDAFIDLNNWLIERVEEAKDKRDKNMLKKTTLINTILVYELADFVLEFIKSFSILGLDELKKIYKSSVESCKETIVHSEELIERVPNSPNKVSSDIPFNEDNTKKMIEDRIESSKDVIKRWDEFMNTIESKNSDLNLITENISKLEFIRDNAYNQLELLQQIEIFSIVKDMISAFKPFTEKFRDSLKIVPLDIETVKIMLGE